MPDLDTGAPARPDVVVRTRRIPPLVWRRLPWWAELLIIATGYALYTRSRVAVPTKERAAFFHASQVWDLERLLHIDIEPAINRLTAGWALLGDTVGYYYGTLHFIVTPAVLIWLYRKRPAAYPRLRSTIVIATGAALVVYWTWPLAPPRFALAGAVDILAQRNIMGAGDPQGLSSMVNLYAAMPSLHVAWAVWCAFAVYVTTSGRWRRLVWLYPAATTFVVVATANHYVLDAVGGVAIVALGLFLTRPDVPRPRPVAPRESIVTIDPPSGRGARRDTNAADLTVLDHRDPDGSIDVRRPTEPTTPSTDR